MITYAHLPEGMLTIISTVLLHVVLLGPPGHGLALGSNPDPGLVYDNYCKDYRSSQYYGCSYEDYMISIIDDLIICAENTILNADHPALGMGVILVNDQYHKQTISDACVTDIAHTEHEHQLVQQPSLGQSYESSTTDRDIPRLNRDFNYPNKLSSYLTQECTEFEFIGPDRQPVAVSSNEQLTTIADIIRSTQLPNYMAAKIPIESGFNVRAWEAHLQDYSDKQVLQYIKFGSPLSLKILKNYVTKKPLTMIQPVSIY